MANPWFRVWGDMVNDPKWRTIARVSKQSIGNVVTTYLHMLTCASNASSRGVTQGWCDEDVATALDIETEQVEAIRKAMQGRVLDGDWLTGWEKRQPAREDNGAASRAQALRDRKKADKEAHGVTHRHASSRNVTTDKIREEEIREEDKQEPAAEHAPNPAARLSPVAELSIAMRKAGVATQPGNPILMALAEQGVTAETITAACEEAKRSKPNEKIGAGYVFKIVERWAADAAAVNAAGAQPPARGSPGQAEKFNPTAYVNRNRKTL